MAVLGVQMMMLREQVAEQGMYPVLERLAAMDLKAVEVSQIPMDETNTAALERGRDELGIEVGALSVALKPGPTATGGCRCPWTRCSSTTGTRRPRRGSRRWSPWPSPVRPCP